MVQEEDVPAGDIEVKLLKKGVTKSVPEVAKVQEQTQQKSVDTGRENKDGMVEFEDSDEDEIEIDQSVGSKRQNAEPSGKAQQEFSEIEEDASSTKRQKVE